METNGNEPKTVLDNVAVSDASRVEKPKTEKAPKKEGRNRGGSKGKRIGIIAGAAVVAAGAITAVCLLLGGVFGGKEQNIFETDAFFLSTRENSDTRYALFKRDGQKLTDFEFKTIGGFVNGYSYVRNVKDKYGIIDHDGHMTVEYDAYDHIEPFVGFYEARKGGESKIILGNGDELASGYRGLVHSSNAPYIAIKFDDDRYELYNALGDKLSEFKSSEEPTFSDDSADTASVLSYKGGLIILSNKNYKIATTVETDTAFAIEEASEDGKTIALVEKNKSYDKDAKRALFANDKFSDFDKQCKSIDVHDSFKNKERAYVTCEKDDDNNMLVRNGEITDLKVTSYGDGYVVYDENHYAYYSTNDKKLDIYVDGGKRVTIDSPYRATTSTKGYVINNYKDKNVTLYNLDGDKIYSLDDVTSGELDGVDKNENIIVRNPKEDSDKKYYVVNKNGDLLSDKYSTVTAHGEYYAAYNRKDNKADLLGKDGKVIASGDYDEYSFYDDEKVILGKKGSGADRKNDLIDAKDGSVKLSIEGTVNYYKVGYFRAVKDKKVTYYTADGKEIHSYEE